jgi:hypothetical protein
LQVDEIRRSEMKCKLCRKNRALLKAKVGDSTEEVCLYCVITEKLEVVEVLDVFEKQQVKECLEEADKD